MTGRAAMTDHAGAIVELLHPGLGPTELKPASA